MVWIAFRMAEKRKVEEVMKIGVEGRMRRKLIIKWEYIIESKSLYRGEAMDEMKIMYRSGKIDEMDRVSQTRRLTSQKEEEDEDDDGDDEEDFKL